MKKAEKFSKTENYMARALKLAENGVGKTAPNPLVGAVVVKDGRIIGEGWHERFGQAHAEVNAVNHAEKAAGSVADATIYVNLEPCCHYGKTPPCTELLIAKKLKRVVIGTLDPNPEVAGKGAERLRNAGIQVTAGVLEDESKELNEVFFHYIQTSMPFVVLKAAVSLDGKIAAYSGKSKWITGDAARAEVHGLRNRYTAVMAGVGTVITDDPELTCRMEGGRNPVRILLDSKLQIGYQQQGPFRPGEKSRDHCLCRRGIKGKSIRTGVPGSESSLLQQQKQAGRSDGSGHKTG